jgi:hypothetical protein
MTRLGFAITLFPALFGACQSSTSSGGPPPQTTQSYASAQPITNTSAVQVAPGTLEANGASGLRVSQISTATAGTTVTVTGLYLGWKGPCVGDAPTRSAWQLAEANSPGAACIYVDGPMLNGVAPEAVGAGVSVRVSGTVRVDGATRYLEAKGVERL